MSPHAPRHNRRDIARSLAECSYMAGRTCHCGRQLRARVREWRLRVDYARNSTPSWREGKRDRPGAECRTLRPSARSSRCTRGRIAGAVRSRGSASACAVTGRGPTTSRRSSGDAAARLPCAASSPRRMIRHPKTRARRPSSRGGIAYGCASNSHRYSEPSASLFRTLVPLFRNLVPLFRNFVPLLFFPQPLSPFGPPAAASRARLRRVRRRLRRRCASGRYPRVPSAPVPHLRRDRLGLAPATSAPGLRCLTGARMRSRCAVQTCSGGARCAATSA